MFFNIGAWRSLAARLLWEQEVGGSNPLAPTNQNNGLDDEFSFRTNHFQLTRPERRAVVSNASAAAKLA